jgi:EH_Signature domain
MLRSALAAIGDMRLNPPFAPAPPKAAAIARLLVERYGEDQEPRKSADALRALLRRLQLVQYDWTRVDVADQLDVAWVLWEGANPPAEYDAFLRYFLDWLDAPNRRYQAARLALTWAAAFDRSLPSIQVVADWLASHIGRLPEPWPRLVKEFDIFSLGNGPRLLAEAFFKDNETAAGFFKRVRLPARAAAGGLGFETFAAAVENIGQRLARKPLDALRLCDLAVWESAFRADMARSHLPARAAALRIAAAETLLLPWRVQPPPPAVKARIVAFLLRHYGDPRVMPKLWTALREPAAVILRRWLTEETVASYFRLAEKATSINRTELAERRHFWLSHLSHIDDAWLLAGPRGIANLGAEQPGCGRLGGCRPDQSALLIRIGNLTILELSHEKSEIIWLPGNPLAPSLFRPADEVYWLGSLTRNADFSSAFGHKDGGTWQGRLAIFIERQRAQLDAYRCNQLN